MVSRPYFRAALLGSAAVFLSLSNVIAENGTQRRFSRWDSVTDTMSVGERPGPCNPYGPRYRLLPLFGLNDWCLEVGLYARAEIGVNAYAGHAPFIGGLGPTVVTGPYNTSNNPGGSVTGRVGGFFDVRRQTPWGPLRFYSRAGFEATNPVGGDREVDHTGTRTNGAYYVERTFIQFAGFTAGRSQSYFDFMYGAYMYTGHIGGTSNTFQSGINTLAYTAAFGNGFQFTVGVEDPQQRSTAVWDASADPLFIYTMPGPNTWGSYDYSGSTVPSGGVKSNPGTPTGDYAAHRVPDIVGSLRVDQAWGSAQIAAALHEVRAGWYGNNVTGLQLGSPETKWGFAVLAGVNINLPWAKGDAFWVEGVYTQGALGYSGMSQQNGQFSNFWRFNPNEQKVAYGHALDGVFGGHTHLGVPIAGAPNSLELTTLWAINAALQHYWTPTLRTSIFGAYTEVDFNSTATQVYAGAGTNGPCRTLAGGVGSFLAPLPGCNPDFRVYGAGIRNIWNPAPQLDIGLEVVWAKIESKHDPNLVRLTFAGAGGRAPGLYVPSSGEEVWSAIFRMQRNFWP